MLDIPEEERGNAPSDLWTDIPNVKSNHIEKTGHPCQFPIALIERLILALTNQGELVFDPFAGVCTSGAAALISKRKFLGAELSKEYVKIGINRMKGALAGTLAYRPLARGIYDHTKSPLSKRVESR